MNPTTSPTILPECYDSDLKFAVKDPDNGIHKKRFKTCEWVAEKKKKRCSLKHVSTACPLTCDSCKPCVDFPRKFKVSTEIGEVEKVNCDWVKWVGEKKKRCDIVGRTCRATCGRC